MIMRSNNLRTGSRATAVATVILALVSLYVASLGWSEMSSIELERSLEGSAPSSTTMKGREAVAVSVLLNASFPKGPSRAMVYRIQQKERTKEDLDRLVEEADLGPGSVSGCVEENGKMKCRAISKDESLFLAMDPMTGSFTLDNMTFKEPPCQPGTGTEIDKGQAVRVARTYLEERGWMPPEGEYTIGFGYVRCTDGTHTATSAIHVGFHRVLNGARIIEDAVTVFSILPDGSFERVSRNWNDLETIGMVDINPAENAYKRLLDGEIIGRKKVPQKVRVDSIELGYSVGTWGKMNEGAIAPLWIFEGEADGAKTPILVSATGDGHT